jgi:hypothetical protein
LAKEVSTCLPSRNSTVPWLNARLHSNSSVYKILKGIHGTVSQWLKPVERHIGSNTKMTLLMQTNGDIYLIERQKQGPNNVNPEPWVVANAGTKQRKPHRTKEK